MKIVQKPEVNPKGAIGEASSKLVVLPSPETIRSSGTGEIAVSNQVTTPYGEAPPYPEPFSQGPSQFIETGPAMGKGG